MESNILAVNKVAVSYRMYYQELQEKYSRQLGAAQIHCGTIFNVGDEISFYPAGDDPYHFYIKKGKKIKKSSKTCKVVSQNGAGAFNIAWLTKRPAYFTFLRGEKGIEMKLSSIDEIENFSRNLSFQTGFVSKTNHMSISKKDLKKLTKGLDMDKDLYYVVHIHMKKETWAEVEVTDKKPDLPRLYDIFVEKNKNRGYSYCRDDFAYYIPIQEQKQIYLPEPFVQAGRIKKLNCLTTWFDETRMIVEVDDNICDICGKSIRYKDGNPQNVIVSAKTKEIIKDIQPIFTNSEGSVQDKIKKSTLSCLEAKEKMEEIKQILLDILK